MAARLGIFAIGFGSKITSIIFFEKAEHTQRKQRCHNNSLVENNSDPTLPHIVIANSKFRHLSNLSLSRCHQKLERSSGMFIPLSYLSSVRSS